MSRVLKFKLSFTLATIAMAAFVGLFYITTQANAELITPVYKVLSPAGGFTGIGRVVADIWGYLMAACNSLVFIMLIAVAFMNILRIQLDSYAVKKILPAFIMAVILANFSFLICRVIIDFGNIAISIFLVGSQAGDLTNPASGVNTIPGAFDTLLQKGPPSPGSEANYYGATASYIVKQLLIIVGAVFVYALAFIMFVRNYFLYMLVAISPVAFLAMFLPMTKKYFQQWWGQFSKWVFMPVTSVFWIWFGGILIEEVTKIPGEGGWLLTSIASIFCFYMAVTSALKFDKAVGMVGGFGKNLWGKTGGAAWNATGGAVVKTAKTNAGLYYNREKESLKERYYATRPGQWQRRRAEAFKLRNEIPGMIRENATDTARKENAVDMVRDPRTNGVVRRRLRGMIRKYAKDSIQNDSRLVTGDVGVVGGMIRRVDEVDAAGNPIHRVLNPWNPADYDRRDATGNRYFGSADDVTDHLAAVERMKQISRGTRAPAPQRHAAENYLNESVMDVASVDNLATRRENDLLRVDTSGLASSAVPGPAPIPGDESQPATAGTPPLQTPPPANHGAEDGQGNRRPSLGDIRRQQRESAASREAQENQEESGEGGGSGGDGNQGPNMTRVEELLQDILSATEKHDTTTEQMAANISKSVSGPNVGLGIASIPEIKGRFMLEGLSPQAKAELGILQDRANQRASVIRQRLETKQAEQQLRALRTMGENEEAVIMEAEQGKKELETGSSLEEEKK